jgi:hypothetical protein
VEIDEVTPRASRSLGSRAKLRLHLSPRQDEDQCCVTFLAYRDHGFIRFTSERTGETIFEIKMVCGSIIVWGAHYRPSEFTAALPKTVPPWSSRASCKIASDPS